MTEADSKGAFLATTVCAGWSVQPLAGDASTRSYDRLTGPDGQTAILMDAGPEAATSIPPFVRIAQHLAALGLCPPDILARSEDPRFLLLSDLGPTHIAAHLADNPDQEAQLYAVAVDVLLVLRGAGFPQGLNRLTPKVGAEMLAPFFDWFRPDTPEDRRRAIEATVADGLATHAGPADTLSLRDFHAENLIWRPHLAGTDRIGLLDFQDAFIAPAAYDLVSLLRDARRDVSAPTARSAMARFAQGTGQTLAEVAAACAVLGIQRNLRILGIFARLAQRDGKRHYSSLIPRVLAHIRTDLAHPAAAEIGASVGPLLEEVGA